MARLVHGGSYDRGGSGYVRGGLSANSRWKADVGIRAAKQHGFHAAAAKPPKPVGKPKRKFKTETLR